MAFNTTTMLTKKNVFGAIAVASVLFLSTGCAPGGGAGPGGAGGPESVEPSASAAPGGESAGGDSAATAAAKECVVGNWWFFEGPELNEFMTATTLGAFSVKTTGFAILSIAPDGSALTTYDHWVNVVMMESAKSTIERDGLDTGTYSIDSSGTMTVTETSIGSVTTWVTETGGETITATGDPEPSVFSRGEFTCSGEELEITVDGATAIMYREH